MNAGDGRFKSSVFSLEPSHTEASDRELLRQYGSCSRLGAPGSNPVRRGASEMIEFSRERERLVNAGDGRFKSSVSGAFSHGRPRSLSPSVVPGEGVWSAASAYQRRPGSTGSFRKGL